MKKKVFFMLVSLLLMMGCQQQSHREDNIAGNFETIVVEKKDIVIEQTYPAQIEGRQSVRIIPRIEGYLQEIRVKEGQRVKKGEVLFILDQTSYQAEAKAAEANVAIAKSNVETAQLNYDSRKTLHQKNIVSDFDLRTAAAHLSMSIAQAKQAEAQLLSANANLSYTVLRSPSDGVVGSLPYRIGDLVGPSSQNGLTTVADTHEMCVYFSLSERDMMSRIAQKGSFDKVVSDFPPIKLILSGGDTCTMEGHVESISGVVESTTGAVSVRAIFPNDNGQLLSGGTGLVVIPQLMKHVIVIPQSATYEIQDKTYVWCIVEGKTQSTIISVLPTTDGQYFVVINGIDEGDIIVSQGAAYVKEGQNISSNK